MNSKMLKLLGLDQSSKSDRKSLPKVMGIINVTPDSFSDGGKYFTPETAAKRALELEYQGADILDFGGESTRPGADKVSVEAEIQRVVPAIKAYLDMSESPLPISIDTVNAETAQAALRAGAEIINDISGGLNDPEIFALAAETGVPYICQHIRGNPQTMESFLEYPQGVVAGVVAELSQRLEEMAGYGIGSEQIILDPGLGFAKKSEDSWEILKHLSAFQSLGKPILIGASRKRFLTTCVPERLAKIKEVEAKDRDGASAALSFWLAEQGIWAVRVHDVAASVSALKVWKTIKG